MNKEELIRNLKYTEKNGGRRMTREEAREIIKSECYIFNPLNLDRSTMVNTALDMAIIALEQEPILDKLIDEIMDTGAYEQEVNGNTEFLKGINYCLGVINKYKAESEG